MNDITVVDLKRRLDEDSAPRIIDVREPFEWDMDHITEENIPLGTLPTQLPELKENQDQEIVLVCRSGGRSGQATQFLRQQGFTNARNLTGGMLAWKDSIDPGFNVE